MRNDHSQQGFAPIVLLLVLVIIGVIALGAYYLTTKIYKPTNTILSSSTITRPQITRPQIPRQQIPKTPTSTIVWGAYVGLQGYDITQVTNFEKDAGKKLGMVMWYQAIANTDGTQYFQKSYMDTVYNHGSQIMVTLEPWDYSKGTLQPNYRLSAIYGGKYDSLFTKWAIDSKNWQHTYYLRFAHEMNGNWYPWSEQVNGNKAGDYVKVWKYVHDIFTKNGASNVKWVWCPNIEYQGSTSLKGLYPGDSYVDYVCMDGYNWGDINGGWQTFNQIFNPTYAQLTSLTNKDIMIGETASAEINGNKASWISNAYGAGIGSLPKVKFINWFNINKEKDWRIESSITAQQAFQKAIADPKFK